MKKGVEQALEECLERILVSGETLEQCLRTYPEQAEQLEPLLRTVLEMRAALAQQPRPEFRAQVKAQFRPAPEGIRQRRASPIWGWQHRLATIGLAVLLAVVLGGSAIAAAERVSPDNPLYEMKLATEQVRLVLAGSETERVKLNANFIDRRMAELSYALKGGKPEKVEQVVQNLDRNLEGIRSVAEVRGDAASVSESSSRGWPELGDEKGELRSFLSGYAREHNRKLRQLFVNSPPSAQKPMLHALRRAWASYRSALESVGENPDVVSD